MAWVIVHDRVLVVAMVAACDCWAVTLDSPIDRDQNLQSGHIKRDFFDRIPCTMARTLVIYTLKQTEKEKRYD